MGALNWLVSDQTKEYCDLGKIFFEEDFVKKLKKTPKDQIVAKLEKWLVKSRGDFNNIRPAEAKDVATKVVAWIETHPDWRFLSEYDDEFDDVYLAEDDADAEEYKAEFGDECQPIYKKTGTVFDEDDHEIENEGE